MLVDLGFADAQDLSAKAILAVKLNNLIDAQALSHEQAAEILGLPQQRISAIRSYKLRGIAVEELMHALAASGNMSRWSG